MDEENDNDEVISSAEPGHEGNTKNPMDGLILNNYFDFAFQPDQGVTHKNQAAGMKVAYEDLVHNDEQIQDSALKEYYAKAQVQEDTQLKMSRTIKPIRLKLYSLKL